MSILSELGQQQSSSNYHRITMAIINATKTTYFPVCRKTTYFPVCKNCESSLGGSSGTYVKSEIWQNKCSMAIAEESTNPNDKQYTTIVGTEIGSFIIPTMIGDTIEPAEESAEVFNSEDWVTQMCGADNNAASRGNRQNKETMGLECAGNARS
uniref:Uncharacterized protein n=1 Tax=Caenorhabditis japonica TaxID=281687 RepID=A0A8R1EHK3_CAEJA